MVRVAWVTEDLHKTPRGTLTPGGCAYYRSMLPAGVTGGVFGKPAWSADRGFGVLEGKQAMFGFDTVVLKLMMQRWVPEQMRQAKALGQRLIVDIDDLTDELHDANAAKQLLDPASNPVTNLEYHRAVFKEADTITVSTPYLLEYYSNVHDDVRLVRNGLNPKQFERHKHYPNRPVIGWVGATDYRSGDLEILKPWLSDFLEEHNLLFLHAGHQNKAPRFADVTGVNPDRVVLMPMTPITQYHMLFQMDIGIAPLNDIPFNRAKSSIKGLEYAASNIPFVASDLPEYRLLADQSVGRLAGTPDEWVYELTQLLDYSLRKREAAVQRSTVLKQHTVDVQAAGWRDILSDPAHCDIPTHTVEYRIV